MAPFNSNRKGKGRGKGNNRRVSHPWINQQIIQASESNFDVLMSTVMLHLDDMNIVNLSTASHRIAKMASSDACAFQAMQQRNQQNVDALLRRLCAALDHSEDRGVQPQTLSNVLWSMAHMQKLDRPLMQCVALHALSTLPEFKSYELATLLWAVAKLGSAFGASTTDAALFAAAGNYIKDTIQDYDFRSLSTVVWAFATTKQRNVRLFQKVASSLRTMTANAACQELANTVWAFGTSGYRDHQLFHELAEQGGLQIHRFKPQELSNMLWGFASTGFFHEAFYAKAAEAITHLDVNSQHLANILWAFAKVRPNHELTRRTVLSLLPLCMLQLRSFKPQEISSSLLAVSKTVPEPVVNFELHPDVPQIVEDFFKACLSIIVGRPRDFSCQSMSNCISSYARVPVQGYEMMVHTFSNEIHHAMPHMMDLTTMVHLLESLCKTPTETAPETLIALCTHIAADLKNANISEWQVLVRVCRASPNLSTVEMQRNLLHLPQSLLEKQCLETTQPSCLASQNVPFVAEDTAKKHTHTPLPQSGVGMPKPLPVGPLGPQMVMQKIMEEECFSPGASPCISGRQILEQGTKPKAYQIQLEPKPAQGPSQRLPHGHDRWFVKNSFLHIEDSDSDIEGDTASTTDCSCSVRSRSQPSNFGRASVASRENYAFGGRVLPSPEELQSLVNVTGEDLQ